MMDSLMNASFLFWGSEATGNPEYAKAALDHVKTTNKLLMRADGSSFHHYQFDPKTEEPIGGETLQGYSKDSTWSRGQAWGAYGFPIAYSYTKEPFLVDLSKNVFNYTLNHLPSDLVPNWDYDFVGPLNARDSSAGVITSCGMKELCSLLPDTDSDKPIYESAAAKLLEAVIDNCTGNPGVPYDGLIYGVTHCFTLDKLHDECAVYGDFFYLEALARQLIPDFKKYW
jgi:unsaturated chondroitin disaccharide hydrolase